MKSAFIGPERNRFCKQKGAPQGGAPFCFSPYVFAFRLAEYSVNEQKRNYCILSATACSTLSEPKAIGKITILRPSGRSGRGAAKNSRASARNMTRLRRIFLPTFSGATEKVGLRSNSCSVSAKEAVPVNTGKRPTASSAPTDCRITAPSDQTPVYIRCSPRKNPAYSRPECPAASDTTAPRRIPPR